MHDVRLPVEIEASPAYELLMSLLVFSRPDDADTFDVGPAWFEAARRECSTLLRTALEELSPPSWLWLHLVGVAYKMPGPRRPSAFINYLREHDAQLLAFHLLGCYTTARRIMPALVQQAQAGERMARARMGRTLFPGDAESQAALDRLLQISSERLKLLVVEILDRWYQERFRREEREVAPLLGSEARAKRAVGKTSPQRLVRFVTRGIDYVPEAKVRRILLIPSAIVRPWVLTTTFGSTRVFCYPVEDDVTMHPDGPPARLVRVHRALAHEDRLRILRLLGSGASTTEDLSRELGRPVARVHAHLVLLRAARLVDLHFSDAQVSSLRPNVVPGIYRMLRAYLPPGPGRLAPE